MLPEDVAEVPHDTPVERIVPAAVRALDLLVRRLVLADQVVVIEAEANSEPYYSGAVDHQGRNQGFLSHRLQDRLPSGLLLGKFIYQYQELGDGRPQHHDIQDTSRHHKGEEETVVSLTDAVPNPRTVVIKPLYTVFAQGAVRAPGRSIDVASCAVLELEQMSPEQHFIMPRRLLGPIALHLQVIRVCVVLLTRHNSRIRERCGYQERYHRHEEQRTCKRNYDGVPVSKKRTHLYMPEDARHQDHQQRAQR
mmetsp:Transcript_37588/g.82474  ORF Transcript_37588/g.82474 Transcript_37588/m.82474 type:complete len:251 (+) Transcript_37588:343-1095(+)